MKNFLRVLTAFIAASTIFMIVGCSSGTEGGSGEAKTLKSIYIASAPSKTSYTVGDIIDTTGLKVMARYSDNSEADVTKSVTISGFDSSNAVESLTITVSYTEGDNTVSTSFTVSIKAKTEPDPTPTPTPTTEFDVRELKVVKTTIDSIKLQWKAPEKVSDPDGYYFTVNGTKSDLVYKYSVTSVGGIYSYTLTDKIWRSETGTEVKIKVSVSYYDSENYESKESAGVEIKAKTEPFDGTLPCYGDDLINKNKQTVQKGIAFDFAADLNRNKSYISDCPDSFEFKSSDAMIATVDNNGIVKGVKIGTAKIMFKDASGVWRYVEFTVVKTKASKIEFASTTANVDSVWTADNLIFTASDSSVEVEDKDIVWSVDKPSIVTVSDGKITFINEGKVTVRVAYPDNSVSASSTITVMPKDAVTKDMMNYDGGTGWYTNPKNTMRYNGKLEIETDWNKDGVWEKVLPVTHKIGDTQFNLVNFEATVDSKCSVIAVPVVIGENKIAITYTIKNTGTSLLNTYFTVNNANFNDQNKLSDGVCRILRENTSKYNVDVTANGLSLDTIAKWFKGSFRLYANKFAEFKINYEVKNITGNLDATIY